MATIQTVPEQSATAGATSEAENARGEAESRGPAGEHDDGTNSTQPPPISGSRARQRRALFGPTAAVTIIAALIASMTLAAVTAFNTLRSDIISVRTGLRDEISSVETSLRDEIGSLRTELHDFRTEVGAVLLDHAERLARIEALLLNGAAHSSQQS